MARRGSKASRGIYSNVRPYNFKQNFSGMVQNRSESHMRPDQAKDIVNMHSVTEGIWTSHNVGYTSINQFGMGYESGSVIDGMTYYRDSTGNDHLFIACNGELKEVNTTTGADSNVDTSAGYTAGNKVSFAALNDVLYTADGAIATPRKWDGTTAGNAGGWPVNDGVNDYDTPKILGTYQNRLVAGNFDGYPSHLILSDYDEAETFTLAGTAASDGAILDVNSGDGQDLVGWIPVHIPRTNDSQLILFKERSVYTLVGNSGEVGSADEFSIVKINGNYGAFNERCVVQVGQDVIALNEFGLISFSASTSSGTLQPSAINSDLVRETIERINFESREECWGIHLPHRREVIFFIPTGASTQCNEAIVYKYPSPGDAQGVPRWSRRTSNGAGFKLSSGVLMHKTFYSGSYTGFVNTMFTSSSYDGIEIPFKYEYPYWDGSNERQIKRVLDAFIHLKIRESTSITLKSQWLGGGNNDSLSVPYQVQSSQSGARYGVAVYGADRYAAVELDTKVKCHIPGNGERLKFTISGTNNTSGIDFMGLTFFVESGNLSHHWN